MYNLNGYKYLEFVNGRKTPNIKGLRINVGVLYTDFTSWGYKSIKDLALDRELPVEMVAEAIKWCEKNLEAVTIDCAEERKSIDARD